MILVIHQEQRAIYLHRTTAEGGTLTRTTVEGSMEERQGEEVKDRVTEVKGKVGREGEEGEKTEGGGRKGQFCRPMCGTSYCV